MIIFAVKNSGAMHLAQLDLNAGRQVEVGKQAGRQADKSPAVPDIFKIL